MFGAPAICAFLAFRFTTEGIGETRPIMYTSLFALAANVFLNWVFMFGHLGAPEMGAVGCGVASAITMWLIMIILGATFTFTRVQTAGNFSRGWHRCECRCCVRSSPWACRLPSRLQRKLACFLRCRSWWDTRAGNYGGAPDRAQLCATMFMVPLALSSATTVRVGQALGARTVCGSALRGIYRHRRFRRVHVLLRTVPVGVSRCRCGLYTRDPSVQAIAISMLLMAAVFQVADGVQIGAAGALRGFKDTRVPMAINTFAYWVLAFPLSYHGRGDVPVAAVLYLGWVCDRPYGCRSPADAPLQSRVSAAAIASNGASRPGRSRVRRSPGTRVLRECSVGPVPGSDAGKRPNW